MQGGMGSAPDDPYSAPLTYPGTPPAGPGLLIDGEFRDVPPDGLDDLLTARSLPGLAKRQPVLSVGSNASPAQLRRKLRRAQAARGTPAPTTVAPTAVAQAAVAQAAVAPLLAAPLLVVPMTVVHVHGLAAGVSAHVSRPGYVPATPVAADGAVSRFFVLWLDADQLIAIDATEPNYRRVPLGPRFEVSGPEHNVVGRRLHLYASRHGCLVDAPHHPRRLLAQPDLIRSLVEESPALRALAGSTPEDWLEAMRTSATREQARVIWTTEQRVSAHPLGRDG